MFATSQEGTASVGLQAGSYRTLSAHTWRHGLSGSLWEGNATALGPVLYRRIVQDRQRRLLSHFGGQLRACDSQHHLCGKRTTHQATTVRPRGTGRRRTFSTPSLVGLHSLQTWPRWTTASGRPLSPRFQRSVFHRRLLSKQPSPVHLLWSRRPMFLARRSVRSRIAFNSVSMPTEAISRHDFLQILHSWCESENSIKPNHFQQRSTSAADRQADRQHSCERSNPT